VKLTDVDAHIQADTYERRQTYTQTDGQRIYMQLFASYMQTDMNTAVRYMHTYDTPGKYDVNTRPSTDITQPRPHMVTDAVIMLPQKGE
jgi:hypothetical protein